MVLMQWSRESLMGLHRFLLRYDKVRKNILLLGNLDETFLDHTKDVQGMYLTTIATAGVWITEWTAGEGTGISRGTSDDDFPNTCFQWATVGKLHGIMYYIFVMSGYPIHNHSRNHTV